MAKMNFLSLLVGIVAMMAVMVDGANLRASSQRLLMHQFERSNIADTAARLPELKIAINAMSTTGLLAILAEDNEYTVFAPSNAAIAALPKQPDPSELPEILQYHVVKGAYTTKDLIPGLTLVTLQGGKIMISESGTVNGNAKIVSGDILANNGVIHVIDKVLSPYTASSA